jgi:hypothetical protein
MYELRKAQIQYILDTFRFRINYKLNKLCTIKFQARSAPFESLRIFKFDQCYKFSNLSLFWWLTLDILALERVFCACKDSVALTHMVYTSSC